jgi:hypothetical protein
MEKIYVWENIYLAAVLETDDLRLTHRIAAALAAINARLGRLSEADTDERQAIAKALYALRKIRDERLSGRLERLTGQSVPTRGNEAPSR